MTLKKDGWLYKVAYGLDNNKPKDVNLCRFFWKFIFMLVIGWPMYILFFPVIWVVRNAEEIMETSLLLAVFLTVIPAVFLFGFLTASHCTIFYAPHDKGYYHDEFFLPYKHWPKVSLPGGLETNIEPWTVFCGVFVFYGLTTMFLAKPLLLSIMLAFIAVVVGIAVGLVRSTKKIRESECLQMAFAYLKTKKERACPIIHFE